MHEPVLMDVRQRVGDLARDVDGFIDRQRTARQPARDRLPVEVLHDEIVEARVVADVVDAADVRVLEARDRFGLAFEPLAHVGRDRFGAGDDLDGDEPIEARIARAVDLAHAALAERIDDLVRSEPGAAGEHHSTVSDAARAAASRKMRPSGRPSHASANWR